MDPILIIDDEKDNLEALQRLLRSDYAVSVETSPIGALQRLPRETFHVIISDQRMPEMSGVEFLEKAKKLAPLSTRILLTGYTDTESVIDAINRGNVYRYIAKPWDPQDLKITLRQANEAYLLRKEVEEKNIALTKSNTELQTAIDELRVLDRAKARFLSLVSHELNTPLTVLQSFQQLLDQTKESLPKEIQKAISSMGLASDRLGEIVNDVLTFVKMETDGIPKRQSFGFYSELKRLIASQVKSSSQKSVQLELLGSDPGVLPYDPAKMRIALEHLLRDTLVRAPTATKIIFSLLRTDDTLQFTIERSGETLPVEALKPLESGQSLLNHQKNLGLSLAIARAIIDSHGGKIDMASLPGGKQRLVISLPL